MDQQNQPQVLQKDPYEVLGIDKDATEDKIKQAYRKLALQYHPDKIKAFNEQDRLAKEERFKEIATAYGILSDPDKKRRYDLGGFGQLDTGDMTMEVDAASLNFVSTAFASMFSRLGVPIKTTIPAGVLDRISQGRNIDARPLHIGAHISDKVEKGGCHFFSVQISKEASQKPLAITALTTATNRLKLLLFDKSVNGGWSLCTQEDSYKMSRQHSLCGVYLLQKTTYDLPPAAPVQDMRDNLFRKLDGLKAREIKQLPAGDYLVAIYGDNWFQKCQYQVAAKELKEENEVLTKLVKTEGDILSQREELRKFEKEFERVYTEWTAALQTYDTLKTNLGNLVEQRDTAYLQIHGVNIAPPMDENANTDNSQSQEGVDGKLTKLFGGIRRKV